MVYRVLPSGASMFDACHASGLGVVLALALDTPIDLVADGYGYRLVSSTTRPPPLTMTTFQEVLVLPEPAEIAGMTGTTDAPSVALGNLDGLLTVAFTTRGARLLSVCDTQNKQRLNDTAPAQAIDKARTIVTRLLTYLERLERRMDGGLAALLSAYTYESPLSPTLTPKRSTDLTIPMTIDPLVGYSTRQPLSDGDVSHNTNLTIRNMPLATPLAFIGAARLLRAQRCAHDLVNLYLPLPHQVTITATTSLPLFTGTSFPLEQALAARWLMESHRQLSSTGTWHTLAFHTLQTQGAQQSITHAVGLLDTAWLTTLRQRAGENVVAYWRFALHQPQKALSYALDPLMACLLRRSGADWHYHLAEMSAVLSHTPEAQIRRYTDLEVKEITAMLSATETMPLRVVLANEYGTKRFGHALRQLGRYNPGALRDLEADLDTVQDTDHLLRVLAQMVQMCVVLKAKSPFLIIPNDEDLDALLTDVDRFGVKRIASVLLILAVLRYPREELDEASGTRESPDSSQPDSALPAERMVP